MPTPRVLSVSCPDCRAPVRITRDREIVTCRYCGHHAFVHFPGKPDPRPPPPPPPPPHVPVQHYYQSYYRPYAQYGHIHVAEQQRIHDRQVIVAVFTILGIFAFAVVMVSILAAAMPRSRGASTQGNPATSSTTVAQTDPYSALALLVDATNGKHRYRFEVLGLELGRLVVGRSTVRVHASAEDGRTPRVHELAGLREIVTSVSKTSPSGEARLTLSEWCRWDRVRSVLDEARIDTARPLDFVLTNDVPLTWVVTYSDGRPGKALIPVEGCGARLPASLFEAPPEPVRPTPPIPAPPKRPTPRPLTTRGRAY